VVNPALPTSLSAGAVADAAEAFRLGRIEADPSAIRASLAAALQNLAAHQGAAGRSADALASAEEAVAILRELADASQAAYRAAATAIAVPTQRAATRPELTEVLTTGFHRVLTLRLARLAYRPRRWPGVVVGAASASIAASWPLLLELVLYFTARRYALVSLEAIGWVVATVLVNIAALVVTWRSWAMLHEAGPSVDELLASSTGRARLAGWLAAQLGGWRQLAVSLLAAGGACAMLGLAQSAIQAQLEIGPVSYVAVAWTAFIGGNDAYWLIAVSRLGRRILRRRDLALVWHSPASTPGIVRLSTGYTFGTAAILLLAIGIELLALQVSRYGDSVVLRTASITFPVLAAAAALIFGVLPHWWLYQAVRDARREVLRHLCPPVAVPPATPAEIAEAQARVSLYSMVESSPGLPFSTGSMVQYTAAVVSTLVGTLVVILLGG
jgi:hypothetical protein